MKTHVYAIVLGCVLSLSFAMGCGKEATKTKGEPEKEIEVGSNVLCTPPERFDWPGGPYPAIVQKIEGTDLEVVYDTGSGHKTTLSNCKLDDCKEDGKKGEFCPRRE